MDPAVRYRELIDHLAAYGSVLVAYSGGVDSTLLAVAAREALGECAISVIAGSAIHPKVETDAARALASELGLELVATRTDELGDTRFASNPPDRCYHCKRQLFGRLASMARDRSLAFVADGTNADDLSDHRPGGLAAAEQGIVTPLADLGLTKDDVRALARFLGLPNAEKPSMACLATRFPYGEPIDADGLVRVERAEEEIRALGLRQLRVRAHGDTARVEVASEELDKAWEMRSRIAEATRRAGFAYASLDLDGYRAGSMNEVLQ